MCLVGMVVRWYIDFLLIIITYLYSSCIYSFLQQHPYFFDFFMFFVLFRFVVQEFRQTVFVEVETLLTVEQFYRSFLQTTSTMYYNVDCLVASQKKIV